MARYVHVIIHVVRTVMHAADHARRRHADAVSHVNYVTLSAAESTAPPVQSLYAVCVTCKTRAKRLYVEYTDVPTTI